MMFFDFFDEGEKEYDSNTEEDDCIEIFVDEILENDKINSGIPDPIERKMYISIITKLVNVAKKIIENISFNFFGYELKMIIHKK